MNTDYVDIYKLTWPYTLLYWLPCVRILFSILTLLGQRYKFSIIEWTHNHVDTGLTAAHEIAHALGIGHDDERCGGPAKPQSCKRANGIMDCGPLDDKDKFTTCSKDDYDTYYRYMTNRYGSFCLACGMPHCNLYTNYGSLMWPSYTGIQYLGVSR